MKSTHFAYLQGLKGVVWPQVRSYEGLQRPGDIIFVPGDWWHGVLNLEDSVAVTQNYCAVKHFGRRRPFRTLLASFQGLKALEALKSLRFLAY